MTFDVPQFILISAFAVAALAFAVPGQVKSLMSRRNDIKAPVPLVMVGAVVQQSLFAVGLAAAGSALAPRTGLEAPWFAAVSHGQGSGLDQVAAQLPSALVVGGAEHRGVPLVVLPGVPAQDASGRHRSIGGIQAVDGALRAPANGRNR